MSIPVETSRRRWSGLRISGVVISVAALILGIVCVVKIVTAVADPLAQALKAPPHPTPYSESMTLTEGSYTVFEQVERIGALDNPESYTFPSLGPPSVRVSGPSGALAVSVPTLDETLDRNSDHFVGFARFTVPEDGDYRIQVVGGAEPTTIIVTPSLGSGFRQVGGWVAGAGGSGLALLVGLGLLLASFVRGRSQPTTAVPYATGYPGSAYPGSGYPGSGYPGSGYPGSGYPGSGQPTAPQPPLTQPATTPAGWYPDPQAPHLVRYWNGVSWTAHTQPRA